MTNVSIIVLDFGSQYTQLIARRLREDKVYCEILPYHTSVEDIKAKMQNPGCSCEVLNPSGGCCLGDTTKAIKEITSELNLITLLEG